MSKTAQEWANTLRHDGNYSDETRDAIHAHNLRLFKQAMAQAWDEAIEAAAQFKLNGIHDYMPQTTAADIKVEVSRIRALNNPYKEK